MTVNAGACAAAEDTVATLTRARNARPGLTSEAVIEPQCDPPPPPGGHALRHVRAHPAYIDPEAEIGEPAAQRRQPVGGQAAWPAVQEPGLSRFREDDEIGAAQREQRLRPLVLGRRRAVRPVQ